MTAAALFLIGVIAFLEAPLFTVLAACAMVLLFAAEPNFGVFQTLIIEANRLAAMPVLTALPLFTLTGGILGATGAPNRILAALKALMGPLPGGIAAATVGVCTFFTAMTGASGVTIAALGGIVYPILRRHGSDERSSLGLLATAGGIGLLFPPSLPVILYGLVAQVEITALFRAALLPGILLVIIVAGYAMIRQALQSQVAAPVAEAAAWSVEAIGKTLWAARWDLPIAGIVIVGVFGGWATIAEVSAVAAAYVTVTACWIQKEISFSRELPGIVTEAAMLSGAILMILAMSLGLTGYLVEARIPDRILAAITDIAPGRIGFLAGLNVFLLGVGCVMDIFSAIVVTAPIIVPVALAYGIDPLHLGVIFLLNLEIGYVTPPMGMNLFVTGLKLQVSIARVYRATLPYLFLMLLFLMGVTYGPIVLEALS